MNNIIYVDYYYEQYIESVEFIEMNNTEITPWGLYKQNVIEQKITDMLYILCTMDDCHE